MIDVETALVPEGAFMMGADDGRPDERPSHRVHVSAFRMALTPVTNAQYALFLEATGHGAPRFWDDARFNAPDQPAVGVTWFHAVAYCAWLSSVTDGRWRLPREAEREKAARGGEDAPRIEGPTVQDAPFAVGVFAPNAYGIFDLQYNVHEWCSDWYDARYYAASPGRDPAGPEGGMRRASRGGAWRHQIKTSRPSARSSLNPTFEYNDYGFRVVCEFEAAGGET